MTIDLSEDQARLLRLRAQRLGCNHENQDLSTVTDVVRDCCGLQAQDSRQAPLSIHARSQGLTAADLEAARVEERSIVRTWCMRGTLHFVTVTDLPWMTSLFGPLFVKRGQRRLADFGLDEEDCDRAVAVVRDALTDHDPLTREEVADRLLREGFEFDPDGRAAVHIVRRACLEGVACEVSPRNGKETYALLDDWVSLNSAPDRGDALSELARRYVAAYEPATPDDLYKWSGLYKRDVRTGWEAIEDELTEVEVTGERAWTISSPDAVEPAETPTIRLLPMYDSYFLGHQDRDLVLPDEYADSVYPGGGLIRAAVIVNGLAVATWTLDRSRKTPVVRVDPFDALDSTVEAGIEMEVADIGRFFDTGLTLDIAE